MNTKHKNIFEGEQFINVNGIPGLYKYFEGDKTKPLIVCIPGGRSSARLFYGVHDGYNKQNFLVHWLVKTGYSVLAISHPIEMKKEIFDNVFPEFSVQDWGRLIAETTSKVILEKGLLSSFYLIGWSAAGKAVLPTNFYSKTSGINLKGFIGLAATPPIVGLIPYFWESNIRDTGYWDTKASFPRETYQIAINFKRNNHTIKEEDLLNYYLGHNPISILGTGWRYKKNKFVKDIASDIEDNMSYRYDLYPMTASIAPTSSSDIRHSLTDKYIWAAVFSQSIFSKYFESGLYQVEDFSEKRWGNLINFIETKPLQLHRKVDNGNHCFFIGENGAKITATYINELILLIEIFEDELKHILIS